ncbi:MAG: hypothetical protein WAO74_04760 [Polaribacter sp.]|uniref:hypothetical protein n=1 Tax=Polaribacter sp. TaxID=1920175 RepID=UPI003BAEFA7C
MKHSTLLLTLFFTSTFFAQSPWTQEKGRFFTNLSFSTISGYNTLFGDPNYNTERTISDRTFQLYGEYGLSEKTSLLFSIPLKSIETGAPTAGTNFVPITTANSETSFGNINLGIKHNFYNDGWVLSGQFNVDANTGKYDAASGIRTGYDAWSFTPLFLAGKSFGKNYFQSFIGADIRTNDYSSNFKIGGELGRKITQNIWLIGFVDVSKSFNNGNVILPQENILTGLYVNNQEYAAYGLKGILEFSDFGVTASFGSAFSGNNVPQKTAFSFGIFNRF